jgi:uncharacterized repeat protein (TIGR01451 family)/LPXTG-motif cell wall-anchored protein
LWLTESGTGAQPWIEVDLSDSTLPTFTNVIDSGTTTAPAGLVGGSDWTWLGGKFQRVMQDGGGAAHLVTVATPAMTQTDAATLPITVAGSITATYTDISGHLYAQAANGDVFDIQATTFEAYKMYTSATTPVADAASCPRAPAPRGTYHVIKTATTAATPATPGTTVTYTVVVTNTGVVPFFTTNPARFSDDLSNVVDDATYNNDGSTGVTIDAGNAILSWTGALAPMGQTADTVTVTYSFTILDPDLGDHSMDNLLITPTAANCDPGSTDPDCRTSTPIPSFHVLKTASTKSAIYGDTVTYTITVTNDGTVDYTAATPATFDDDLTDVLDDAVYNNDATGGATYVEPVLSWTGPLVAGQVVTIKYTVKVNDPDTGDNTLANGIISPPGLGGNCPSGSPDPDCNVEVPSTPPLALTGVDSTTTAGAALGLILLGVLLTFVGYRRRRIS